MQKHLIFFLFFSLTSFLLPGQATTNNIHQSGQDYIEFDGGWVVNIDWNTVANYCYVFGKKAALETRYTFHFRQDWNYTNTITGETVKAPTVGHTTGVYTYNGPEDINFDVHQVEHWVKDPLFGGFHLVQKVFFGINPETGFFEIIDIKNEWARN